MTTNATDERPDAHATTRPSDVDGAAAETAVPDGADAAVCDRCGRPFSDGDLLALHLGSAHPTDLSAEERAAYESADRAEAAVLRVVRLQALAVLVVLYFGFLFAYAVFW